MRIFSRLILALILTGSIGMLSLNAAAQTTHGEQTVEQAKADILLKAGMQLKMYNFVKQEKVLIPEPHKMSVDAAAEFIPQFPEALAIYHSHLDKGAKPMEAVSYTYAELMELIKKVQSEETN